MTTFERNILDGLFELSDALAAITEIRREEKRIQNVERWINPQLADLRREELHEREKRIRREVRRRIG